MKKMKPATAFTVQETPLEFFSKERVGLVQARRKARRLTEYCIACEEIHKCRFGQQLRDIHEACCASEVGHEFLYCASCSHTLIESCPIDKTLISDELHEQLARCNEKRGFAFPLCLLRFDVLVPSGTP